MTGYVITRHRGIVTIELPVKLVAEGSRREHWRVKSKRVKAQKAAVGWGMRTAMGSPERRRWSVHLVRIAPRLFDDLDNLVSSAKAARDAVAEALGVDDADLVKDPWVRWTYGQEKGAPRYYGVRIQLGPQSALPPVHPLCHDGPMVAGE